MAVSIQDQVACVKRELGQRERVYARLVANGRMSRDKAIHETAAMQAVLETLQAVERGERLL